MKNRNQILLEKKIRKMVREELENNNDPDVKASVKDSGYKLFLYKDGSFVFNNKSAYLVELTSEEIEALIRMYRRLTMTRYRR